MIKNNRLNRMGAIHGYWPGRSSLLVFCLCAVLAGPLLAVQEHIVIRDFALYQGDNKAQLTADIRFDYQLSDYLRASLLNGITLRNEIRFELRLHRDWWWNEAEILDQVVTELKYDALTKQYQVVNKNNGENRNYSNLAIALEHLGDVRRYQLPPLPDKVFEDDTAIYIQARLEPRASKSLPEQLSDLFSDDDRELVSQGVMWPLTR